MLNFKFIGFNKKDKVATYIVTKSNFFIIINDLINLGLNKKIIDNIYEEKFGEKYICTIDASSLNRAKEIYEKYIEELK